MTLIKVGWVKLPQFLFLNFLLFLGGGGGWGKVTRYERFSSLDKIHQKTALDNMTHVFFAICGLSVYAPILSRSGNHQVRKVPLILRHPHASSSNTCLLPPRWHLNVISGHLTQRRFSIPLFEIWYAMSFLLPWAMHVWGVCIFLQLTCAIKWWKIKSRLNNKWIQFLPNLNAFVINQDLFTTIFQKYWTK